MIDLYYWTTPNGHKITIFLEEAGLPYAIKPVNISKGEQFDPEFLKLSPNNRIPAIVDHDPADGAGLLGVFESGAILQYLAKKTGKLMPAGLRGRTEVMQWLFWQMSGLGPAFIADAAPPASKVELAISKFAFAPKEITVAPGTTIVWTNRDDSPHTVASNDKSFASKGLDTDDRYEHAFDREGDFNYICTLHPFMTGVVHVRKQ